MISNVERVMKKAYKDAEKKGMEQGIELTVIKVARQMLVENEDIEKIKRYTGLSDEEIEKLK